MTIYDFEAVDIDGNKMAMEVFRGKVLLIVNIASKCGFTPQLAGLEALYREMGPKGLVVLGFPCDQFAHQEPGSNDEIKGFCQLNYGVTFPLSEKIEVNGVHAHPLYEFLKDEKPGLVGKDIKWNFTKFLVDRQGRVLARFAPTTEPEDLRDRISAAL